MHKHDLYSNKNAFTVMPSFQNPLQKAVLGVKMKLGSLPEGRGVLIANGFLDASHKFQQNKSNKQCLLSLHVCDSVRACLLFHLLILCLSVCLPACVSLYQVEDHVAVWQKLRIE